PSVLLGEMSVPELGGRGTRDPGRPSASRRSAGAGAYGPALARAAAAISAPSGPGTGGCRRRPPRNRPAPHEQRDPRTARPCLAWWLRGIGGVAPLDRTGGSSHVAHHESRATAMGGSPVDRAHPKWRRTSDTTCPW